MPRRKGNRKLTDAQVIGIREKYRDLRLEADPREPYGWTDGVVAYQYGVSAATVRGIVMGLTRKKVGGPIDTVRVEEAQVHYHGTPADPAVEVVVDVPGRGVSRFVYPAGTTVAVNDVNPSRGFLSDTP